MIILAFIIGWLTCSFLAYGLFLGEFTKSFPVSKNFGDALLFSTGGPISFLVEIAFAVQKKELNFRIKPLTTEQRFEKFNEECKILGRAYFDKHYN